DHDGDEFGLARHVGVDGHGADTQRLTDPAHGQRVQALGVGDVDRGPHDPVDAEALPGAAAGRFPGAPEDGQAAGRVRGRLALTRHGAAILTTRSYGVR